MLKKFLAAYSSSPFLKHNAVFFVGSLAVAALNYFYYPILGRMLSPADFGEVQTLLSLFMQVSLLLGILSLITIHITVNEEDPSQLNHNILGIEHLALKVGAIFLLLTVVGSGVLKSFLNFTTAWPFIVLAVSILITMPLTIRMAYLRGNKLFLRSSLTDGIGSFTKILLSAGLVVIGWRSLGAIVGLALSQVIALYFGYKWASRAGLKGFGIRPDRIEADKLKPQLRYGLAVLVASFSVVAIMNLDILAAKHYLPPEQAGLYAGVAVVGRIVFFLTAPFTTVLLASVNHKQSAVKNKLQLAGSLGLVAVLGSFAVLGMYLLSDTIVNLLVGAKYSAYASMLPRLGLAMLALALANTILMYQITLKKYQAIILPFAATILTLFLAAVRHNSVSQIVTSVLIGSLSLLTITTIQFLSDRD